MMVSTPAAAASSQNVTLPFIAELFDPNFLDVLVPSTSSAPSDLRTIKESPTNPMMEALTATAHHTHTLNGAPAFDSTLSQTLDAFQSLNRSASASQISKSLDKSWTEDPNLTLRIIWNLRSLHDGKSEKDGFYKAFGWLYDNHPRTALANLHLLVKPVCTQPGLDDALPHGYWKDLLNIITLATAGELVNPNQKTSVLRIRSRKQPKSNDGGKVKKEGTSAERIEAARQADAEKKAALRREKGPASERIHQNLLAKLQQPKYRALYITVARLFAEQLTRDLVLLRQLDSLPPDGDRSAVIKKISLAGKWAPSPGAAHDRHTNIATAIILLLHAAQATTQPPFPAEFTSLNDPLKSHVLRSFYQSAILTPLRKVTQVPERLMCANRWTQIKYDRVSAVCMNNNSAHFHKHDPAGFEQYISSVESGTRKISGATLLPHILVNEATALSTPSGKKQSVAQKLILEMRARVAEAQWKTLIGRLREAGTLDNALAICDVSGSMGSFDSLSKGARVQPIQAAVALSLILAQLARPPFDNGFITFSTHPQFVKLDPALGLAETVAEMRRADWGMSTDFNAVFLELLLPLAKKNKLKQEDMIKRLFVFSDMQFDDSGESESALPENWTTNHDVIEAQFREAGYEMPEIVYWDLTNHGTVPVTNERKGVALMNGFSPSMLKVFMGDDVLPEEDWEIVEDEGKPKEPAKAENEFNPLNVMKKALMKPSFDDLVVID